MSCPLVYLSHLDRLLAASEPVDDAGAGDGCCCCWPSVSSPPLCSGFNYTGRLVTALYRLARVWLGFLNFFFWAACLCWIAGLTLALVGVHADKPLVAAVLFSLAAAASVYGLVSARLIRVRRIAIQLPGLPGIVAGPHCTGGQRADHLWARRSAPDSAAALGRWPRASTRTSYSTPATSSTAAKTTPTPWRQPLRDLAPPWAAISRQATMTSLGTPCTMARCLRAPTFAF